MTLRHRMSTEVKLDSVVTAVIQKFQQRAEFGQMKYGTNLDRTDLSVLDWIQHAQEEHMDAILYLEKLKREFTSKEKNQEQKIQVQTTIPHIPLHHQEESTKTVDIPKGQHEKEKEEDKHLSHWGC